MKYFRMSYEEVVFRRSYINIMLLNKSIPSFDFDDDKDEYENVDEYTAELKRMKKQARNKSRKPKEKHTRPSTQHANDFFSQFM